MPRLPVPGNDSGTWGDILNEFLGVEHNSDGTLKASGTLNTKLSKAGDTMTGPLVLPSDPTTNLQAATKQYVDTTASSGAPDADALTKGIVQLAGDLSGTATSPQIATGVIVNADINASAAIDQSKIASLTTDLSSKQNADADLTAIAVLSPSNDDILQRKAGAWTNRTPAQLKLDLALTSADVGLGNVDNTSDANKPISTAAQTALNLKADTSNVMDLTTAQTVTAGVKKSFGHDATNAGFRLIPSVSVPSTIMVGDMWLNGLDSRIFFAGFSSTVYTLVSETRAATLTNKTLTSPVIDTGVSGSAIDTDGTLAANSNTRLASQRATKTYVDNEIDDLPVLAAGTGISIVGATVSTSSDVPLLSNGVLTTGMRTMTLANGANNNIPLPTPASTFIKIIGPTGAFSLSGISGGVDGMIIYLVNRTGQTMTLTNDATSTAANRILTMQGIDQPTAGDGIWGLIYDGDLNNGGANPRWVRFSGST